MRFGLALQLQDFRLEEDGFLDPVETHAGLGRNFHRQHVAAHLFDDQLVLKQFLTDPVRVGVGKVALVDRDDDRNLRRLGVMDGFDRLRHDAVVGRHHQHHHVRDVGAARPHLGEGGVARRVDEGDLAAGAEHDLIGADMLGDAAGLAGGDVGRTQRVEQRGLAVVDVAHDGDDGSPRDQVLLDVLVALQADFDVGFRNAAHPVAELGHDQLRRVGVDGLVDRRHHAHAHQRLDHVGATLGHAVGEFLNRDDFRHHDVAGDLHGLLPHAQALLLTLTSAPQRRHAAGPFGLVAAQRLGDRHLAAAAAAVAGLALGGGRSLDRSLRSAGAAGGDLAAATIVLVLVGAGDNRGRPAGRGFGGGGGSARRGGTPAAVVVAGTRCRSLAIGSGRGAAGGGSRTPRGLGFLALGFLFLTLALRLFGDRALLVLNTLQFLDLAPAQGFGVKFGLGRAPRRPGALR